MGKYSIPSPKLEFESVNNDMSKSEVEGIRDKVYTNLKNINQNYDDAESKKPSFDAEVDYWKDMVKILQANDFGGGKSGKKSKALSNQENIESLSDDLSSILDKYKTTFDSYQKEMKKRIKGWKKVTEKADGTTVTETVDYTDVTWD